MASTHRLLPDFCQGNVDMDECHRAVPCASFSHGITSLSRMGTGLDNASIQLAQIAAGTARVQMALSKISCATTFPALFLWNISK